jgi:hypothetical protein
LATRKLRINAGVFNPFSRHPTMMAMEAGALDELSGGRTAISIGAGIMSATKKMGFRADKPVPALRDTIAIVRGLLCGNEVDHVGPFFSARKVKLDYKPRAEIPIFLAGRGDLTVKLSGEAADGLIVSNMCSIEFAGRLAVLMQSTRRSSGRLEAGEVCNICPAPCTETRVMRWKPPKLLWRICCRASGRWDRSLALQRRHCWPAQGSATKSFRALRPGSMQARILQMCSMTAMRPLSHWPERRRAVSP